MGSWSCMNEAYSRWLSGSIDKQSDRANFITFRYRDLLEFMYSARVDITLNPNRTIDVDIYDR